MSIPKNFWGDPVDVGMQRMQKNVYNPQPSGLGQVLVGQGEGLGLATTVYPRSFPEEYVLKQVAATNEAMSCVHDQVQRMQVKVEMLTGFYTWMTQMYPDLVAQHKAMCDLYAAANPGEDAGTTVGGMK